MSSTSLPTATNLTIRPATPPELPQVLSVLDEAAAWLQAIGVTEQWPAVVSQDPTWVQRFSRFAAEGRVFIALAEAGALGTFHLRPEPGLDGGPGAFWSLDELDQPAVYLFSLAVRRSVAGQGVAAAMLQWALDYAQQQGKVLRLDCWAGNDKLRGYYSSRGFDHLGDREATGSDGRFYSVSRFQRIP